MPPKRRVTRSIQPSHQQSLHDHFQPASSSPTRPSAPKKVKKARRARLRSPTPQDSDHRKSDSEIQDPPPSSSQPVPRTPLASPLKQSRFLLKSPSSSRRDRRRRVNPLEVDVNASSDGSSSDIGHIRFEPKPKGKKALSVQDISDSEEDNVVRPSTRKLTRVVGEPGTEGTPESDASCLGSPKNKRKSRIVRRTSDSTASELGKPSPRKRPKNNSQEQSDEDEDMSGIDDNQIVSSRLRKKSTKLSAKQKLLEKLKSKRSGRHVDLDSSDEDADENDDEDEEGFESPHEDDIDADVIPGARPDRTRKNKQSISDTEEAVDDFIVQDSDGPTSVAALPSAFSMNIHQDITHHFKIVCQFFVHLAVASAKKRSRVSKTLLARPDEYFSVPLTILNRKLSGLRDTIASSVWRPHYTKVLKKYPDFEVTIMDFAVPYCDACHLTGRKSKYIGRLSGQPYDSRTFEPIVKNNTSSSSESDSDSESKTEFYLGRYCARRTRIFHELTHWEQSVYTALSREVDDLAERGSEANYLQMGKQTRLVPPEDPTDADEIIEWLDQRGIIDFEWGRIKQLIAQASNLDADARKEGPDD